MVTLDWVLSVFSFWPKGPSGQRNLGLSSTHSPDTCFPGVTGPPCLSEEMSTQGTFLDAEGVEVNSVRISQVPQRVSALVTCERAEFASSCTLNS